MARESAVSSAHLSRIEAGSTEASRRALSRVAAVLGADVSERVFPTTGPRIRDRTQASILEALLQIVHPRWARHLEVTVYRPVRGVIDLVLGDRIEALLIATEIQSQLRRLEQEIRWSHEKADALAQTGLAGLAADASVSRLLILRSTAATRELATTYAETMRTEYPASAGAAYAALAGSAPWPGSAILWARVEGSNATILETPPRGIGVGGR